MCFSPEADLIGGTVITLIGIDAVRNTRHQRELPVAALPLLLGAHQLIETFVWWGLQGHVPEVVGDVATWAYLIIAFVVLPPYVPLAVASIEPTRRRRVMIAFAVLGGGVAAVLAVATIIGPVTARLADYHVSYGIGLRYGWLIVSLYVMATCGALLVSSYPPVAVFGAVNLAVVVLLALAVPGGFASLWCAWAAVTSAAIAVLIRTGRFRPEPALST